VTACARHRYSRYDQERCDDCAKLRCKRTDKAMSRKMDSSRSRKPMTEAEAFRGFEGAK
jgi:hypothetical protein